MTPEKYNRLLWIACVAGPLAFGLMAVAMGQDTNWDLRNYHYYNAYAFLNGRMGFDVNPAQIATFHNPLIELPFYWAVQFLPPRAVGFCLGAVQGLNFALLLLLAHRLFIFDDIGRRLDAMVALATVGMVGAGMLSELGTVFYDNIISLAVLGALLLVVRRAHSPDWGSLALAGLVMGMGVGLKEPSVLFAIGICLACLTLPGSLGQRLGYAFVFGLGVLGGMALTSGFWMWRLWRDYGNPQFPYMNDIFHGPLARFSDYRDHKFLQTDLWQALDFPIRFGWDGLLASEVPFRDMRIAALYVAMIGMGGWWLAAKLTRRPVSGPVLSRRQGSTFVLVAMAVAYVLWLKMFGVYRYLIPLELLAPICLLLCFDRLPWPNGAKLLATGAVLAGVLLTMKPVNWGRVFWSSDYFGVEVPPIPDPDHTAVLMLGLNPISFVIPAFPPQIPFWRIHSYFTNPFDPSWGFTPMLHQKVAAHQGPLYALFGGFEEAESVKALATYGLTLDKAGCRPIHAHILADMNEPLQFCPVRRE